MIFVTDVDFYDNVHYNVGQGTEVFTSDARFMEFVVLESRHAFTGPIVTGETDYGTCEVWD